MKWFNPVPQTAEELKAMYKKLALANHPDRGGKTADMQEINGEYERLFARLKDVHRTKDGETYTARTATTETAAEFVEIIDKLVRMDGVIIELCGSWLWLSGNTKEHKDAIKELGFRWSANKSAWYFHKGGYKKLGKKPVSMDRIRYLFGSEIIDGAQGGNGGGAARSRNGKTISA